MSDVVLKYPGAKWRLADWIISYFPQYKVYCEPYFGSGAVFFRKPPSLIETINDIDGEVINFFKVMRNYPEEFARLLNSTPFARQEYYNSFEVACNDLEKARRFAVKCWQSFSNAGHLKKGWKQSVAGTAEGIVKRWNSLPESVLNVSKRLKETQIENRPALQVIQTYNNENVLLYIDPPYLPGTWSMGSYKHEMTIADHELLLKELLKSQSKVIISGYSSELYNDYLKKWSSFNKKTTCERGLARNEVIWCNYDIGLFALL